MAYAIKGLRVKPNYESLINVAVSDKLYNIEFPNPSSLLGPSSLWVASAGRQPPRRPARARPITMIIITNDNDNDNNDNDNNANNDNTSRSSPGAPAVPRPRARRRRPPGAPPARPWTTRAATPPPARPTAPTRRSLGGCSSRRTAPLRRRASAARRLRHSAKGGAVETWCSDVYYFIY